MNKRNLMILLAVAIVLVAAIWTIGQGRGTSDQQDSMDLQQTENRELTDENRDPADINQLRDAIAQAQASLDRRNWDATQRDVERIRQRWLSFKPKMRALAGTRMWSTTDVNDFESALNQALDAVASEDDVNAHDALQRMGKIAAENDTSRSGAPADPRIRGDSGIRP